jgi:EAL domain-containing protein (putative c-di-GMP-specific phosphodiesterase class I)
MANPIFDALTPNQQRELLEDSVIEMVSTEGLDAVAEVIESDDQYAHLNEGEVQFLLGYLDAVAAPLAKLAKQYIKFEVEKILKGP